MLDLDQIIDTLDFYLGLSEESQQYADEHIPDDMRDRANEHPDPESELRGLVLHLAALSDRTRRSVIDALAAAKNEIARLLLSSQPPDGAARRGPAPPADRR